MSLRKDRKAANTTVIGENTISGRSAADKPKIEVKVDLKAEEGDQKNVDAGHYGDMDRSWI